MTAKTPPHAVLRQLPSVDQLLRAPELAALRESVGTARLTAVARGVLQDFRSELRSNGGGAPLDKDALWVETIERIQNLSNDESLTTIRKVINATGVILHTNLGRAPLPDAARTAMQAAAGYCTLEYDTSIGGRGSRGRHVEELLRQLTGAEAALVVNNCAAAALLILTVLARDGETIVSRGELVEIGGDFRVPEVMENSGTRMIEVGSTNRTHLSDYKNAITGNTKLILRVHQSNYRIVGFSAAPELSELATLAHDSGLPLYEDAGSGVLRDLSSFGLTGEPVIEQSLNAGADVVSFSGDKLLGATQAGLIVGRKEIVNRLRKHPLYRALRCDKVTLAALEATLEIHRRNATSEIPVLRMLSEPAAAIGERAKNFCSRFAQASSGVSLEISVVAGTSAVGGGSAPEVHPATTLLALKHQSLTADELERKLRFSNPPVIARIADNLVLLDLRTVTIEEEDELRNVLMQIDKETGALATGVS